MYTAMKDRDKGGERERQRKGGESERKKMSKAEKHEEKRQRG